MGQMITRAVIDEICAERDRQDAQWGGPAHDDTHDAGDWADVVAYQIEKIAGYLMRRGMEYLKSPDYRGRLVKIAAIAVAGLESMDRKAVPQAINTEGEKE